MRSCALLLLVAPLLAAAREPDDDLARRRRRDEWWLRQRAFPSDAIPPGALADAWARWPHAAPVGHSRQLADTRDRWTELGPSPLTPSSELPNGGAYAGRLRAVAIDPTDARTLYVGAAQGGVWKSSDGGATWTPLTDDQPSLAIGALAIDPATHEIWAGTGEDTFGFYGQGLLHSSDGGQTWDRPAGNHFAGAAITQLRIDGDAIYVATSSGSQGTGDYCSNYYVDATLLGLWRSSDGGGSWTRLAEGDITSLAIDTSVTPRRIYYAVPDEGAYLLVDGQIAKKLALPKTLVDVQIAVAPSRPQTLYAGGSTPHGNQPSTSAIYASHDGGATWELVPGSPDYCYDQCYYTNAIAVHPTDPGAIYVGGGLCAAWKATGADTASPTWRAGSPTGKCSAQTWNLASVHPDAHGFAIDPRNPESVYIVTDGGLFHTTNGAGKWKNLNATLGTIQFYGVCLDAADPGAIHGGAQDNGSFARSPDGSWTGVLGGDGGHCVANARASDGSAELVGSDVDGFVYVVDADGNLRSSFYAEPGACQASDPGCGDRVGFIVPLVGDPTDARRLYVGTHRLWRSSDGGDSWDAISPDLTRGKGGDQCLAGRVQDDYLTAIAVAPGRLYTGSAGGRVMRSLDNGATWVDVSVGLPRRWVAALAVDAAAPDALWVAFSGFTKSTPKTPGHVFHSTDAGTTWSLRDIPTDEPVNSIAAHPVAGGLLYAGTDLGALVTSDGGATWTPLEGLPRAAVYDLAFHAATDTLVAGTHGRGAWSRALTTDAMAVAPASLAFKLSPADPPSSSPLAALPSDASGATLHLAAAADSTWLTVDPPTGRAAGQTPFTLTVTASAKGLAPGKYDGTITLTDATLGARAVPVHLTVADAGCGCHAGGAARGGGTAAFAFALVAAALFHRRRIYRARR